MMLLHLTKVLSTVPVFMKLMDQYQIGLDHEVAQYYPKFNDGNKKILLSSIS